MIVFLLASHPSFLLVFLWFQGGFRRVKVLVVVVKWFFLGILWSPVVGYCLQISSPQVFLLVTKTHHPW